MVGGLDKVYDSGAVEGVGFCAACVGEVDGQVTVAVDIEDVAVLERVGEGDKMPLPYSYLGDEFGVGSYKKIYTTDYNRRITRGISTVDVYSEDAD